MTNKQHNDAVFLREEARHLSTATGAPKPLPSSPLWNEWAANNPQPEAIALANLKVNNSLMMSMKGICQGARPIEN
jgi:hypothetical protein